MASLAAILAVTKLGMAMAAMMARIATTIISSTSENPFSLFIPCISPLSKQLKSVASGAPFREKFN